MAVFIGNTEKNKIVSDDIECTVGGKTVTLTNVVDQLHPVGSIYLSTDNVNPSTLFGGTWELFYPGKTLVCIDTNQTEFDTVEKTGGHKSLQAHMHGVSITTSGVANHTHEFSVTSGSAGGHTHGLSNRINTVKAQGTNEGLISGTAPYNGRPIITVSSTIGAISATTNGAHTHSVSGTTYGTGGHSHSVSGNTGSTGDGNAQNLQPYVTCYIWKRTA